MRLAVEEAQREIANHRDNYMVLTSEQSAHTTPITTPAPPPTGQIPTFNSVLEAYELAAREFGGTDSPLVFLESARESAAASPYLSPEQVYFLIKELHLIAKKWREGKGKLGTDWRTALLPTGFEFKPHISATTKGKFGDDYQFMYDGKKRLFEEHVTKGAKDKNACFSLHLYRDETRLRVVIGHCGNHLTNTST